MAIVSDVEIRLRADIARLQQDMDRARQSVSSTMGRITSLAKGAMGALAAIGGVAMFAGFVKSAVDALDVISDISQRTGIAVEELAGLQLWFQKGGMEADALEGAMVKLSRSIADGGKEFKKLGVSTREADGSLRSNVAVLLDSADAFAKMQDGTAKTALAVDLFGKSGAALLPMLNEGSKGLREMNELAEKLGLTFDQQTVDAAGQFNDTLDFMGLAAQGVGRQLAAELLPTMNSLIGTMFNFASSGNGVRKAADIIATGFKIVYTAGVGIVTLFNTLAETISGTFSFIGNNLSTLFMGLKQAIEGNYAQAWNTLTQGGQRSAAILSTTFGNVKREVVAAASTVSDAWTGAGGESVAALVNLNKARKHVTDEERKAAEKAAEDARKAAEKNAEAYADMLAQVNARVAATAREADGLAAMSEAEKFAIDLADQLARGKIKLTETQEKYVLSLNAEAGANAVLAASNKEYEALLARLAKNAEELTAERTALIDSAREEAEQNELLITTFGMSEAAIIRLHAARLLEQEAQRLGRELTAEEIADLQRVIELKERSATAIAKREELEKVRTFWTDIEKTAGDTFRSIADGGKDLGKRLKDTLKNTFFDWLYQQTLKKWIINIGTSVSGTAGVSGIANAAEAAAGGGGSILGSLGNAYSAISGGMTAAGGLGTGFMGSLAGGLNGAGVGSGLTSSIGLQMGNSIASVLGPSVSGAISSGLSTLAAAAPYAAIAVAVYALAKKAFGMGPKEYDGTSTISGWIKGDGTLDAGNYADWTKEGGWLRSNKTGSDRMDIQGELAAGILSTYETIKTSTMDYAKALGLNAEHIANRAQGLNIALGKDEAANQKAIETFFTDAADHVAREVLPSMALFQREGETAAQTLQRMATNATGVEQVFAALGTTTVAVFGEVSNVSMLARERLVDMAGGVQNLATMVGYFQQNILSDADRVAATQGPLQAALESLGHASLKTTDEYKAAVLKLMSSGALATEEGAKQYAGLLALGPQFKMAADYMASLADAGTEEVVNLDLLKQARELQITIMEMEGNTIGALAERRRMELEQADDSLDPLLARIHALQDEARAADEAKEASERLAEANRANGEALTSVVDKAMAALGRAVQAQKDRVTTAYQETMRGLEVAITSVNATIERTGALSKALRGAIQGPAGAEIAGRGQVARAEITAALTIARASGVLPTPEGLAAALSAVTQDNSGDFATLQEYQRAVARTNAELESLGGLTDDQLDTAQRQLKVLEDQKSMTQAAYEAELQRLDKILEQAQAQVDAAKGVDNSVRSVEAAVAGLGTALSALRFGATPTTPSGVNGTLGTTVEEMYRKVLGRDGDAAGIEFWKKAFGSAVDQSEYLEFIKGAQSELSGPPVVATTSGTMGSSSAMVAELQTLNTRMANVEISMTNTAAATGQFAYQFNQVSAGGNALATESIVP